MSHSSQRPNWPVLTRSRLAAFEVIIEAATRRGVFSPRRAARCEAVLSRTLVSAEFFVKLDTVVR